MYIVIELQTNETTAAITTVYNDLNTARQQYHTILAAAAVSKVPVHAAVILSETGGLIAREAYTHGSEEATA